MREPRRHEVEEQLEERRSEATSKETLEDLEKTKKVSDSESRRDAGQAAPSPDGEPGNNERESIEGADI
jgi:hypothetical protein